MITLTLPYPPSTNRIWKQTMTGSMYRGRDVMTFYKAVAFIARQAKVRPFGHKHDVIVTLRLYRPLAAGDLDNRIKATLDALKGHAFTDDKQVVEIHAFRFDDKANPRVEVEIIEKTTKDTQIS